VGPLARIRRRISNWWILQGWPGLNLWVDDERPAPPGWYHATSVEEAQDILVSCIVEKWSLDHDLGEGGETYDLVKWLARELHENDLNFWPGFPPTIHTQNPVGRENIRATVDRYGPYHPGDYEKYAIANVNREIDRRARRNA